MSAYTNYSTTQPRLTQNNTPSHSILITSTPYTIALCGVVLPFELTIHISALFISLPTPAAPTRQWNRGWQGIGVGRDAGRMAVNLAIHFPCESVMANSTPTGAYSLDKLDKNIMKQIAQLVLSKFRKRGI
jgi:hypothetical protein